jgi:predicted peptidase
MGGRGAWQLAVERPKRFAAVVPICGRVPDMPGFYDRLAALRDKPIWVFHGGQDDVVREINSRRIVAALREMGSNVRYTMYPEAGHDSWTPAYAEEELWAWLGQQRLG